MNSIHGLRVAVICACVLMFGCKGGDGGDAPSAAPTTAVGPPAASDTPPPPNNAATTAAAVSWVAPLENVDGTALTDLAGFVIVYGTSSDVLSESVYIDNPSVDRYLVEGLTAGTWYFGVKAYSAGGKESTISAIVSKTID